VTGGLRELFGAVGEPLPAAVRALAADYVVGLEARAPAVAVVPSWTEAARLIRADGWDPRFAAAEARHRERLRVVAQRERGEATLSRLLSVSVDSAAEETLRAATAAAARAGCSDEGMIRAAAGAASEALYLGALAEAAAAKPAHPFSKRRALFLAGRWPLGVQRGVLLVF